MRVEVVESLTKPNEGALPSQDDAGVERALRSFSAAIESDDSLLTCEVANVGSSGTTCGADFALRFRGGGLASNRRLHFSMVEKLVELLREAGSPDALAAQMCLTSDSSAEAKASGFALRMRLEARGDSPEQARLRWGLGVAHVQQALLFTSRYLRQQIAQNGD
jgi:hypothetical protein